MTNGICHDALFIYNYLDIDFTLTNMNYSFLINLDLVSPIWSDKDHHSFKKHIYIKSYTTL